MPRHRGFGGLQGSESAGALLIDGIQIQHESPASARPAPPGPSPSPRLRTPRLVSVAPPQVQLAAPGPIMLGGAGRRWGFTFKHRALLASF
jgi:hypothetical protein